MAVVSSRTLWRLADSSLCLFVFFPSLVFYWRGIWDLYGVYIYPDDELLSDCGTFLLGCCAVVGYFVQPGLGAILRHYDVTNFAVYVILSRVCMYVHGVTAMAYWRGVWHLANRYLAGDGELWKGALAGFLLCYSALLVSRTSRTLLFPPFAVARDTRPDLLQPSTRLDTKLNWRSGRSIALYAGDCVLTQHIIMMLVIVTWRCALTLIDVTGQLLTDDPVVVDIASAATGVLLCSLLFLIEPLLAAVANKCRGHRWKALIWSDVVCFCLFFGETFLWFGVWNLNARFLIADPRVGGWANHAVGTVLLMSIQLFSYAGSCGCARDGPDDVTSEDAEEEESSKSSCYGTEYLRHYFSFAQQQSSSDDDDDEKKKSSPTSSQSSLSSPTTSYKTYPPSTVHSLPSSAAEFLSPELCCRSTEQSRFGSHEPSQISISERVPTDISFLSVDATSSSRASSASIIPSSDSSGPAIV